MVHAGKDIKAYKPFVVALGMYPVQIGIGNVIARSPDGVGNQKQEANESVLIAYLSNDQIYIEPVDQKTIANLML